MINQNKGVSLTHAKTAEKLESNSPKRISSFFRGKAQIGNGTMTMPKRIDLAAAAKLILRMAFGALSGRDSNQIHLLVVSRGSGNRIRI